MKIAILDLYEGEANEGMRCILQIVEEFKKECDFPITCQRFDVRKNLEIADLDFDIYISSGGPGSPITSQGSTWEQNYFGLMNAILQHNRVHPSNKKRVFLICHSFQIFCRYYNYAKVTKRKSTAFGVMPIHKTKDGKNESLLRGLGDMFYAIDSRDYQILEPNESKIWSGGGHVLCIEKERPFIPLARAVMAIRFNESIIGMQFHPEADSDSMHRYLLTDEKRELVIKRYGEKKYTQMLQMLNEPEKIKLTYKTILPGFLRASSLIGSAIL
jgi:GMP synthase - Glutamine amidotransferase domain